MSKLKETTQKTESKDIEETLSQLAGFLGSTDLDRIKMFTILTKDQIRNKTMLLGDIENYRYCKRLRHYANQDLFLNCSLEGERAKQIVEIAKASFQIEDNKQEKSRLRRVIEGLYH